MVPARERNYHLDTVRVLAAFSVVFTHLRQFFLVPYAQAGHGVLVDFLYIDHYLARAGVMCFFVLSGYLVGTSVIRSIAAGRWSWRDYLTQRLTRLEIVLIPSLLLTAVLDHFGNQISSVYTQDMERYTWLNFGGCALFLQHLLDRVTPFGCNGPLWSLSYEFWYYVLFAAIAVMLSGKTRFLPMAVLTAALLYLMKGPILELFPCWCGGVLAGYLGQTVPLRSAALRRLLVAVSVVSIFIVVLAAGAHRIQGNAADYALSALTVLLIWACLCSQQRAGRYAVIITLFSEFSYSLYLTHSPVLRFLESVWLGNTLWKPDTLHTVLLIVPFLIAMAFAYLFYRLFEANTDRARRWIKRNFQQNSGMAKGARADSNQEQISFTEPSPVQAISADSD